MSANRGRLAAVVAAALLLAVTFSSAQAAPSSGGPAAGARQVADAARNGRIAAVARTGRTADAAGVGRITARRTTAAGGGLVGDAAGRFAAWLAALLAPGRPGGGAGPWPPQVTCDAGSQMDPNGKCVAVPTGPD